MRPLGVHHVSLNVDDVEAGVAFYTGTIGGTRRDDRPDLGFEGAWIDLGAQQLHLLRGEVPPDHGQHVAVHVADLDGVVEELRGRGVEVSVPVVIGTGRQCFLHDPAGNLVELHESGPRA